MDLHFGVIGQQATHLKTHIHENEEWLREHLVAEVRAEFVRQVVSTAKHLLEEGLKFDNFMEGLAAKERWDDERYAEHERGRDTYMAVVAGCLAWSIQTSHGLDLDCHEEAKRLKKRLDAIMSDQDDDDLLQRPHVTESIKRAEADFAAGRYLSE